MNFADYRTAMHDRGIMLNVNWVTTRGDFPFTLHGCRAHEVGSGKYLGLVIVQQMLDPEGEPDGIVTYTETQRNDLDADALAILEMGN